MPRARDHHGGHAPTEIVLHLLPVPPRPEGVVLRRHLQQRDQSAGPVFMQRYGPDGAALHGPGLRIPAVQPHPHVVARREEDLLRDRKPFIDGSGRVTDDEGRLSDPYRHLRGLRRDKGDGVDELGVFGRHHPGEQIAEGVANHDDRPVYQRGDDPSDA